MNCLKCGTPTLVIDSRYSHARGVTRRRRKCPKCKTRKTSYERFEGDDRRILTQAKLEMFLALRQRVTDPAFFNALLEPIENKTRPALDFIALLAENEEESDL